MVDLFEKTVISTTKTYNSIVYQRRMNILSALLPNSSKVKEILKEQSLDLNAIENSYLSEEKFEEKLSKIISAKGKYKTIFTWLQKSLTLQFLPVHSPSEQDLYSKTTNKEQEVKGEEVRCSSNNISIF